MEAWKVKSLRYASNETSYNNWRGAWGGFTGWATAGIKVLLIHGGTISSHRAVFNQAHGLWLDSDNEDVTVGDRVWCGNLRNGGFIEASPGPIMILRATACLNGDRGILTTATANLTIRDSVLYGNGEAQFEVGGDLSSTVTNWETGGVVDVRAQNLTLCGNVIVGERSDQDVLAIPHWSFLLGSLRSTRNDWWNPHNAAPFRLEESTHLDLGGAILEVAQMVKALTGSASPIAFGRPAPDDPRRRRPDLTKARRLLGYEPRVPLEEGLRRTIAWVALDTTAAASGAEDRVTRAARI